jgi:hypothetical protein
MTARVAGILILLLGAEVAAAQGVSRTTGTATGQLTLARAEALIRETSLTVEQLRQLRFKRPVAVEVVDPATARQHFEEDIDDEDRERARHIRDAWVQIGLIAPEPDLVKARLDQAENDVAGYYKSGSDTFRLLSHVSESEVRAVMAHELTHALEDQHYDLLAVQKRATNADQAVAIRSVIEGSAMVTTLQIQRRSGGIGKAKEEAAQASQARAQRVRQAPTWLQMQVLMPYTLGFSFLLRGKPWELLFDGVRIEDIDKAYAEPPHSTREILHPEQYWDAVRRASMRKVQLPDLLPLLGKGWTRTAEGSVGELGLTLMTGSELVTGGFQMLLPTRWTTPGAAGTSGDYFHHYVNGEQKLTVMLTRWESVRDADEFQRTLRGPRRTAFRFGASLLLMMGDVGDKGERLAAESVRGIQYWAGE